MNRYLEVVDAVVTAKNCLGRLTVSPSEGRVTLKVKSDLENDSLVDRLIELATYVKNNSNAKNSLRGKIKLHHNSLQVTIMAGDKGEKESYVLNLDGGGITNRSTFYKNRYLGESKSS